GSMRAVAAAQSAPPVAPEGPDPLAQCRRTDRHQPHDRFVRVEVFGVVLENAAFERLAVQPVLRGKRLGYRIAINDTRPIRPPVVEHAAPERVPARLDVDLEA